ncbi:amino acid ABC transporter substrate-binding protein [Thalassospira lucentensis]|uniref:amino acid ABC transporter substrate-binding protein n=1 Tax=Thalassospira lucentensis TaxID=168935 RepID=UPI00142DCA47|nr:amino acid ABC transporter substrate-binding protein [Thalassospira lucentensis]NIZ00092.1 amino acid ABC transporter substrate-binding protein [Thalassospira lucentensis]
MQLGLILVGMMASVLCVPLAAHIAQAAPERVITFPVINGEIDDVLECAQHPTDTCGKCTGPAADNVSLMNYSIMREALKVGGIKAHIKPVPSPNSERSRMMVQTGAADIKTDWAFNIDDSPNALKTEPFIRVGEYEKGLYTSRRVAGLYANTPAESIQTLRAVSLRNWRLDWQVLESLTPASVMNVATQEQIFSLIEAGRADFTLLAFSSAKGMMREINGIELFPIPGVKVALAGSQHFMVSRHLKDADALVAGLNRGIKILYKNGFIRRCLINSGIVNPQVADWKLLDQPSYPAPKNQAAPTN